MITVRGSILDTAARTIVFGIKPGLDALIATGADISAIHDAIAELLAIYTSPETSVESEKNEGSND